MWLELSLTAIDLLAWTRVLLRDGELAGAEPKKIRYRLLHVATRLTRGGRRLRLRISAARLPRAAASDSFAVRLYFQGG
ncbi:transposase [Streptomyces sp. NPDC087511]|uniref:transposase n=1 Tax=Streptomyces sp. NPDC087511 TaxID=3365792 RepID=UPI0038091E14